MANRFAHRQEIVAEVKLLAGSSNCVEIAARDAADPGYDCILVRDVGVALEQSLREATLRASGRYSGGMVRRVAPQSTVERPNSPTQGCIWNHKWRFSPNIGTNSRLRGALSATLQLTTV
jgi:hypothetical protein